LLVSGVGCISVYYWQGKDSNTETAVLPVRRFEAHVDGSAVTAIRWDGTTLNTDSARGETHVFDGLTFRKLRSFPNPIPQIRGHRYLPPIDPNDDGRVCSDNDSIPASGSSSSSHENDDDAQFPDFSPVPLLPAMRLIFYPSA